MLQSLGDIITDQLGSLKDIPTTYDRQDRIMEKILAESMKKYGIKPNNYTISTRDNRVEIERSLLAALVNLQPHVHPGGKMPPRSGGFAPEIKNKPEIKLTPGEGLRKVLGFSAAMSKEPTVVAGAIMRAALQDCDEDGWKSNSGARVYTGIWKNLSVEEAYGMHSLLSLLDCQASDWDHENGALKYGPDKVKPLSYSCLPPMPKPSTRKFQTCSSPFPEQQFTVEIMKDVGGPKATPIHEVRENLIAQAEMVFAHVAAPVLHAVIDMSLKDDKELQKAPERRSLKDVNLQMSLRGIVIEDEPKRDDWKPMVKDLARMYGISDVATSAMVIHEVFVRSGSGV